MIAHHPHYSRPVFWTLALLAIFVFGVDHALAQRGTLEPVTLQLKWTHQFQSAGYCLALERGYYREAGLDVTIVEGGPEVNVADEVLSGRATFGVGTSELLLDYAAGKPVVVLGVIYQHSPQALVMRTDASVHTLQDLRGKRVMMEASASDLLTMLKMEGLNPADLELIPHNLDPKTWRSLDAVAISAYMSDEPFLLDQTGIEYRIFSPRSYGIDFYGDNFFTRADLAGNKPDLARRFRDATLRGWEDARDDPYAAIELILAKYSQRKSRAHLIFEANKTLELMTNIVQPGHMERRRWEDMGDTYLESGMLEAIPNLAPFLFDHRDFGTPRWLWEGLALASGTVIILSIRAAHLHVLNRRMQDEIQRRLASELELRQSRDALQHTLSEVKQLKEILPICAYCKKIRDDDGYWEQLETYISEHGGTDFSHGICPDCVAQHYPEFTPKSPEA
jgi:ABC-type nitrate/sulfonate/bicarbonate transport system substrate-binding protein